MLENKDPGHEHIRWLDSKGRKITIGASFRLTEATKSKETPGVRKRYQFSDENRRGTVIAFDEERGLVIVKFNSKLRDTPTVILKPGSLIIE